MISTRHGVLAMTLTLTLTLTLGPGQHLALAQALSDPMRPPAFANPASAGESSSGAGLVLQSTLLSKGRRIAMIDGKPMKVGDRIGSARIISIDPGAVTLREANKTRVLQLYPGVEVTRPGAAKAAASRKSAKEGAK
jgi:MSHA biogenesis protein MshK